MGFGGISIWQLLIILLIVVLIFGGKKLRSLGSDLGGAIRGFKSSMDEGEADTRKQLNDDTDSNVSTDASTEERVSTDATTEERDRNDG